jgi:hypothetical protein
MVPILPAPASAPLVDGILLVALWTVLRGCLQQKLLQKAAVVLQP